MLSSFSCFFTTFSSKHPLWTYYSTFTPVLHIRGRSLVWQMNIWNGRCFFSSSFILQCFSPLLVVLLVYALLESPSKPMWVLRGSFFRWPSQDNTLNRWDGSYLLHYFLIWRVKDFLSIGSQDVDFSHNIVLLENILPWESCGPD